MMAQMLTHRRVRRGDRSPTAARRSTTCTRPAKPNVILLDLMMPVMDGWEFRRQQQADPELAPVPVIVLSALDQTRAAPVDADAVPEEAARLRSPPRAGPRPLPLSRTRHAG